MNKKVPAQGFFYLTIHTFMNANNNSCKHFSNAQATDIAGKGNEKIAVIAPQFFCSDHAG